MSFGFGFGFPSWRTLAGGFSPAALFVGGVQGAWYDPSDLTTLFTTSAGTTPVAMPGQGAAVPVGLMLDKSQGVQRFWSGYFDGAGDYLACGTNSAFAMGSGDFTWEAWVYFTGSAAYKQIFSTRPASSASSANGSLARNPNNGLTWYTSGFIVNHAASIGVNTWVHVAVARQGTTLRVFANGTQVGSATNSDNLTGNSFTIGSNGDGSEAFSGYISNVRVVKGTAVYTGNFTPPSPVTGLTAISGTSLLTCQNSTFIDNSSNAFAITVNGNTTASQNIPLGNHAIAFNDTTARPELRARVNLLTYSEEFDNGAWNFASQRTSIVTTGVPYYKLAEAAPAAGSVVQRIVNGVPSINNVDYVFSVVAKADTRKRVLLYHFLRGAWFDLVTGQCGADTTYPTSVVPTMVAQNDGSYICTMKFTAAFTGTDGIQIYIGTDTQTTVVTPRVGDGTSGVLCKSADLRPANIGANVPAYQRIADANTYDTSGFPLYLRFDGIDDSMYTPANLNLSGTDKVAVFAGVRKLSDAATGVVAELSPQWNSNSGSFAFGAPNNTGITADYSAASKGSAAFNINQVAFSAVALAPISNVYAATHDIPGDLSAIRLNGVASGTNGTGDKGAGNFGTYQLFIGARNNSSLWFNGHLHSLIVVGSAVSAGNISATEQWVAGKMGIQI